MNIEQEIFSSYRSNKEKLIKYGFISFDDVFTYSKEIINDSFKVLIVIDEKGTLSSKVIEKEFNEEYFPLKSESYKGTFVSEVREAYQNILLDIKDKCFEKVLFVSNQANRISKLILDKYKESPDFPFSDSRYKNYGVFRYSRNKKWYAIVMNVSKSLLGKFNKEDYIDIVNVKIDESRRDQIINIDGIYPAYHMNKKKWVSIVLDETLNDEEIITYISNSRNMIKK